LPGSSDGNDELIARRLDELGVAITPDEVDELLSAYDALQAWLRIAEELGGDRAETQARDDKSA
jgi:hypothetical protein